MLFSTIAFAEGEAAQATTQAQAGPMEMIMTFLPLILIFAFLYFIMIRPQRKKEKELKAKIDAMKVGDKVTTIGGIRGKISKIKDDFVILETGNIGTEEKKSYIKLSKSAINEIEEKISN